MPPRLAPSLFTPTPNSFVCARCRRSGLDPGTGRNSPQRRWITRNHIRNIRAAEEDWEARAEQIRSGKKKSMLTILEERGFVHQIVGTREKLDVLLTERRIGAYVGVDPTAPSLHIGHMIPLMALAWMYIHGYGATFLVGGSTSAIGDPTGRLTARDEMRSVTRRINLTAIHMQMKKLGVHIEKSAAAFGYQAEWAWKRAVDNNNIWWQKTTFYDIMKAMGSQVRLGPLLGRDTVKNRMDTQEGMSFAEFCYPVMQAWDWWHLFQKGCQLQIGGADQFGNILAGADAVSRTAKGANFNVVDEVALGHTTGNKNDERMSARVTRLRKEKPQEISREPMGFTTPLLTNSANEKFGKTAGNAIWMDRDMTSSFDLYQFFLRTTDTDVERYLKMFTFMPLSQIEELLEEHKYDPSQRIAQHKLAYEFVRLAHGLGDAQSAAKSHSDLFKKDLTLGNLLDQTSQPASETPAAELSHDSDKRPGDWNPSLNKYASPTRSDSHEPTRITLPRSLIFAQPVNRILWSAGLVSSKSEGARLIMNKGCHIGSESSAKEEMRDHLSFTPIVRLDAGEADRFIIDGELLILRVGKWKMRIINIVSDEEFERKGLTCPGWEEDPQAPQPDETARLWTIQKFRTGKNKERSEERLAMGSNE